MTSPKNPLALLALLFLVYQVNLRQVSADTAAARLVPISLVARGDLTVDEFGLVDPGDPLPHYLARRGSHLYDAYPIVAPLLAAPFYALPVWFGVPSDPIVLGNVVSKLVASLMAAGSASLIWLALVAFGHSTRMAWFVSLVYGLGTSIWSTASQGLWTHGPAVLAFSAAILLQSRSHTAASLAALAVGGVARPVMLLILPIWLLLARTRRTLDRPEESIASWIPRAAGVSIPAAAIVLAGFAYNIWLVGSVFGTAETRNAPWTAAFGVTTMWGGNFWEGAVGQLVAPSRGLLVYSPILLLAAIGGWRAWTMETPGTHRLIARASTLAILIAYLAYSKYLVWWAGHAYGPRYLTDLMPFFAVLMALGLQSPQDVFVHPARRERRRIARPWIALAAYSIVVQAIGAFCWPSARDGSINMAYYESLWDWRHPQILNCLESGPRFDPIGRRMLARLGFDVQ